MTTRFQFRTLAPFVALLALLLAACSSTPPPQNTDGYPIQSDFATDADGWQIFGDAQGSSAAPTWVASGGAPGGYIQAQDDVTGGVWYFEAPAAFLGDRSGAYGGELAFDLRQSSTSSQFDASDVELVGTVNGATVTLVYDTAANPETSWTSYQVPLDATAGWTVDTVDGAAATEAQLRAVLGDLEQLLIRGEYREGADTGGLDNPTLSAGSD